MPQVSVPRVPSRVIFILVLLTLPAFGLDLGTLSGEAGASIANAINDRGQVVGSSSTASGEGHAFFWERGSMVDMGTLPGGTSSDALAINRRGQVAGISNSPRYRHRMDPADRIQRANPEQSRRDRRPAHDRFRRNARRSLDEARVPSRS
jgi:probable HAF family extracellular repeat protein